MELPEYQISLIPTSDEAQKAQGFRWAGPEVGNRSKIGGAPDLEQRHTPVCPSCKKEMTFYAQLDSIGDSICLADAGMIYTFVCFDCFETTSFIQSS
jgi:hypothetical protein